MKNIVFATLIATVVLFTSAAVARGGGPGHVVYCSYDGTNSPNHNWSTTTADGDDTIHATNLCLNQGGSVRIRPISNSLT